jgi:putative ABC transport system permease protein
VILQHIQLAFRQIGKQKFSFAIAILGLAISFAAVGHLVSYSLYYLDYDKSVENNEEWYRLRYSDLHPELGEIASASFFIPPAPMLLRDIPEVKEHIVYWPSIIALNLRCDGKPFQMEERVFVSANFPEHYKMQIIYGNPDSLLSDRNGILISESISKSFFGDVNPVGKSIYVGENPRYYISGVFADLKSNLHLKHDHYSLWYNDDEANSDSEDDWYLTGHVRLRISDKEDIKLVERKLNQMLEHYRSVIGQTGTLQVHLDPISKIHFMPGLKDDAPTMSIMNIWSILALSLMILAVALINFLIIIGLSWKKRGDEFYFRRAVGAGKSELFWQMIWEYSLYYGISVLIALGLYAATIGIFRDLVQADTFSYSVLRLPYAAYAVAAILGIGLSSGWVMSLRHSRVMLHQNAWHSVHKHRGSMFLLFMQMIISFAFIAVAFSVSQHYSFIRHQDLGWESKNTIQYKFLTLNDEGRHGYYDGRILRQRIREIPGVAKESVSNFNVASNNLDDFNGLHEIQVFLSNSDTNAPIRAYLSSCMPDFFAARKVRLLQGHIPTEDSDSRVVINERFAKAFLGSENPLGNKLSFDQDEESTWYEVSAVVEDSWYFPTHNEMIPLIYLMKPNVIKYYQITWQEGYKQEVISALEELFADAAAGGVFGYSSREIETEQDAFYAQDRIYKNISLFMAIFVGLLAMMGIYAVSSVSVHAQMKDISIRKVCGAELPDLLKLYFRNYLYLYTGSGIIGLYLAYNLISIYADRFTLKTGSSRLGYPVAILLMALVVFIPLYINILKAYKADANRYLQAD